MRSALVLLFFGALMGICGVIGLHRTLPITPTQLYYAPMCVGGTMLLAMGMAKAMEDSDR